jgi:hypothetical protein
MEALASLPKSRVTGDAFIDAAPMIETPALLRAPIQKCMSDARVCLTAKDYKATLAKVEQIRAEYAGSPELSQQSTEIARIEKAARDGNAGSETQKVAVADVAPADPIKRQAETPKVVEVPKVAEVAKPATRPEARTIDLLAQAGVRTMDDFSSPSFLLSKGELSYAGYKNGSYDFNYQPPDEYDYKLVFKLDPPSAFAGSGRNALYGFVLQYVPLGSKSLVMYMPYGNSGCFALDHINRTRYSESSNITRREHARLKVGQEYTVLMKVRRDAISASLDGELVVAWRRDGVSPTNEPDVKLSDSRNLGVGAINRCNLRIVSALVTEISGPELAKK